MSSGNKPPAGAAAQREPGAIAAARRWISDAASVLVVAGAGMSAFDGATQAGMNVYVNPEDFKKHYPGLAAMGLKTAYQCMGLFGSQAPVENIYGYLYTHIGNMRYKFPPNPGYKHLKELLNGKDYFVVTSNVDGCFVRSGFDKNKIYTPQGDWSVLQCSKPCSSTVYASKDYLQEANKHIDFDKTAFTDKKFIPRCPNCGEYLMGNVRGGDWFVHKHWEAAQGRLLKWIDTVKEQKKNLVVLEIGAGFNTPVVTRFPAESVVRMLSGGSGSSSSSSSFSASLVRINPSDPEVPLDLKAAGIQQGWGVLKALSEQPEDLKKAEADEQEFMEERRETLALLRESGGVQFWQRFKKARGHYDYVKFWKALND